MDKTEQFDFLKNYYELLKSKDAHNIGSRFLAQAKQLANAGEIDKKVLNIIIAGIAIGQEMNKDLTSEDIKTIKDFINIGIEMKEEQTANSLAQTLVRTARHSSVSSDPCSSGYSGMPRGGC